MNIYIPLDNVELFPVVTLVLLYYFTTIVAVGTILGFFVTIWEGKKLQNLYPDTTSFTLPKGFFEETEITKEKQ